MDCTKEEIDSWLKVYNPSKYGISYPEKEEIIKQLENEETREDAILCLWRFYVYLKHFCKFESGQIPEREETKQKDVMYWPAHENDIGQSYLENNSKGAKKCAM